MQVIMELSLLAHHTKDNMQLKYQNKTIIIADDSENAQKIKDGYDFEITDKGILKIKKGGSKIKTKWQLKKGVDKIKTIEDVKKVLKEIAEIIN